MLTARLAPLHADGVGKIELHDVNSGLGCGRVWKFGTRDVDPLLALLQIKIATIDDGALAIVDGLAAHGFACPAVAELVLVDANELEGHGLHQGAGQRGFAGTWQTAHHDHEWFEGDVFLRRLDGLDARCEVSRELLGMLRVTPSVLLLLLQGGPLILQEVLFGGDDVPHAVLILVGDVGGIGAVRAALGISDRGAVCRLGGLHGYGG
mmetsp:Transcript_3481/g.9234  ORF Transcript_3481/g.9234 Transcript_3481/m.9234 type:complete len:208 (+) Transcript_3481:2036-2659(+)